MDVDRYGTAHTNADQRALAPFEDATHAVLAHRPNAGAALEAAIAFDPALVSAHALKGFACLTLAREELFPAARSAAQAAREAQRDKGDVTAAEAALVDALALGIDGRFGAAADRLHAFVATDPHALLHLKLAQSLRFMVGDVAGMLADTRAILPAWDETRPGFGYLLGCHAFALEETGEFAAAETAGRRAVALAPDDAWGLHSVAHVYEMRGRTADGIGWIEAARPVWTGCNNFAFHMAWHLALFHLEAGDDARVLHLYDTEVRPRPTDDFRDMANAVSLLWRLELEGVAVGDRWEALAEVARRRRRDTTLAFAALHNLIALVAAGDNASARELAAAMAEKAREETDQGDTIRAVGLDLAGVIVSFGSVPREAAALVALAPRLQNLGGSHAQRDVFVRTLARAAADRGDRAALDRVLAARRRLKCDDRFVADLAACLDRRPGLLIHG
ncbi:tetratricopeptide repeat-containing protein [Acuticoccus sediminis]|uniref:Tetratricopeptide repeat protein 38 n=1 Tax=Acuticoccus sediminis TaxID=2184697 RepID=A0A8B2NNU3_9HYPH|nr:tetratricopeptide repeat protein [Acuticoccus sediminis]RAI01566.1 tetratricopeptide repeat-containing protein [Acuticoccus sediminis]